MEDNKGLMQHLDGFNKTILDLRSVDVRIEEEVQGIIFLSSLFKSYEDIVDTMMYEKDNFNMNEVRVVLNSKEIQMKIDHKEDETKLLYVRGKSEWKNNKHK